MRDVTTVLQSARDIRDHNLEIVPEISESILCVGM